MLSIIVPAYKQEKTIKKDLESILRVLEGLGRDFELICVVDGNVDGTFAEAQKVNSPKLQVYSYDSNHGKGYAVRYGMAKSKGDIVGFIDAGMEIDPTGIIMAQTHMDWYDADVIVASKQHPVSKVHYPFLRRILSLGYQLLVRVGTGLKIKDTQTGLKLYKLQVLQKILPRLVVEHYSFDLEMLSCAHRLGFARIFEAPVKLSYNFTDLTHAATLRSVGKMFYDTLAIIYRLRFLRFYDGKNKHLWPAHSELNMIED